MLRSGSNITAHCQSASGRNLSLATEVLINGTPVTERDGYSLELVNLNMSGTVVCEAVQQGNNSRDLRDNASASFIVLGEGLEPHSHAQCKQDCSTVVLYDGTFGLHVHRTHSALKGIYGTICYTIRFTNNTTPN